MLKLNKRRSFLFVLIIALFGMFGCERENEIPAAGSEATLTGTTYLVENNLKLEEILSQDAKGNDSFVYLKINGLEDKKIQEKVNTRIKEVYDQLTNQDISPYRGIRTLVEDDAKPMKRWISMNATLNVNNVLSIRVDYGGMYPIKQEVGLLSDRESQYVGEVIGLNFNLNTGDEIQLKEIFRKDSDYMTYANNAIAEILAKSSASEDGADGYMHYGIKTVSPFKGIVADQQFIINTNGISFIFDYNTPQFQTGTMAVTLDVSFKKFDDQVAVFQNFYHEGKSIFQDSKVVKQLISDDEGLLNHSEMDTYQGIEVYLQTRYSENLPRFIKERIQEMCSPDLEVLNKMAEEMKSQEENSSNEDYQYERSITANKNGHYVNLLDIGNYHLNGNWISHWTSSVYNIKTSKEMKIKDLFKNKFEYESKLKSEIEKQIISQSIVTTSKPEEILKASTFSLDTQCLTLYVDVLKEIEDDEFMIQIPYKDIGCENMTIF